MNSRTLQSSFASAILLASTFVLGAQTPKLEFPSPSPACTIKQHIGLTDIEVAYSRPSMKGRQIFGSLVPYGEVWRTGANGSTKVSFSTPVKLNGHDIPAGKYALYTIPGETEWTVIIYKNPNLGGAFNYDPKDDLVRFKVTPVEIAESVESLAIEFNHIRDESAVLYLLWDKTLVPIELEVDVAGKLKPQIEAAMAEKGDKKPYYQAAMFYYDHDLDLKKASKWVDAAMADHETYYIAHLKAKILAKLGNKDGAIAAAKHSSELATKAEGPKSGYIKMNEDLISSLR